MSEIRTNKIDITLNYENITNDFCIVRFTTSKKYIPSGALFLDEFQSKIKLKSVVFSGNYGDRNLYTLFSKQEFKEISLRAELNQITGGEELSFDVFDNLLELQEIPKPIIAQLLINSLSSPNNKRYSFNNLSGHFYYFNRYNFEVKTQEDKQTIFKVKGVQIRINTQSQIELNVKTFSNLLLSKKLRFTKEKPLYKYPKYTFSYATQTLKRIINDKANSSNEVFINKQEPNKKSTIPFINFSSLQEFNASKMGALNFLLQNIDDKLNNYISIAFNTIEKYKNIHFDKSISKNKTAYIQNICLNTKLNIIDSIEDENSSEWIDVLKSSLGNYFPLKNIKQSKKLIEKQFNLKIIHNKSHYEKYNQKDTYKSESKFTVHHLTIEDFNLNRKSVKSSLETVIKELIIKNDICNRKVSIINWQNYGYKDNWIFGIKNENEFSFLTIKPSGELSFCNFTPSLFNQSELDIYCDIFNNNDNIEGIVINSNSEINTIQKTNEFTIPDFQYIYNSLELENQEYTFKKGNLTELFMSSEIKPERIETYVNRLSKSEKTEYSKNELVNLINQRNDTKLLSKHIFSKTGILLKSYLRDKTRYEILNSNLDICYLENESSSSYFVGTKGEGIQSNIPRAAIIREIQKVNKSPMFFDELLPLMNVDFVKNGDLTVTPFPFKYLKEWLQNNKK